MSFPVHPDRISADELVRLKALGEEVRLILMEVGLTASFDPNPVGAAGRGPGALVSIDHTVAGQVFVYWACDDGLRSRFMAAFEARDLSNPDLRRYSAAHRAMGAAMVAILSEVGYEAGLGADLDPNSVWVRRASS